MQIRNQFPSLRALGTEPVSPNLKFFPVDALGFLLLLLLFFFFPLKRVSATTGLGWG